MVRLLGTLILTQWRHARRLRLLLRIGQCLQLLLEARELKVRVNPCRHLRLLLLDERLALFALVLSLYLLALPLSSFLGGYLRR